MPSVFELLDQASAQPAPPAAMEEAPNQFTRGLRAGLDTLNANVQNFVGGGAQALGADEFARERFDAARAAQEQAQAEAAQQRVQSFRDVHSLRDAGDYLAAQAGGLIPTAALGVAGGLVGRTPVGRVAGGAAALLPSEAGDVVGRQQASPEAMQAPADDRFVRALEGGGVSALANAAPGASAAGKMAGTLEREGAGAVVRRGLRELPTHAVVNAGLGAGSEAVKQVAAGQPTDMDAIEEAGVGGAVMGTALHGLGTAVEAGRAGLGSVAQTPANVLAGVKERAKDALAPKAPETGNGAGTVPAGEPLAAAKVEGADPLAFISDLYDKGKRSAADYVDRVAKGEDVADIGRVAGQAADKVKAMLPELDAERVQKVKDWATELMDKGGLDEGRRAQLAQAMTDLTDRGNQAVVAGLKKTQDTAQRFGAKVKGLYDSYRNPEGADAAKEGGAKKSEDYSGIRQAINDKVLPVLKEHMPEALASNDSINHTADALRGIVDRMASGHKFSDGELADIMDTFGPATLPVLEATHQAVFGSGHQATSEAFFGLMNHMHDLQTSYKGLADVMLDSLKPEYKAGTGDLELQQAARRLIDYVRNGAGNDESAATQYRDRKFRESMTEAFGPKLDAVLEAAQKAAKAQDKNAIAREAVNAEEARAVTHVGEEQRGRELSPEEIQAIRGQAVEYTPKDGALYMEPSHERRVNQKAGRPEEHDATRQAIAKATKENPDKTVSFVPARELGEAHPAVQYAIKRMQADFAAAGMDDAQAHREAVREIMSGRHGVVAAEGTDVPGTITRKNVRQVMVASKEGEKAKTSHRAQDSVFKVDGVNYDAIKLTKLMKDQFQGEFHAEDEKGAQHRTGRLFMAGVAALQDHLGKAFTLPDALRIDHDGTTYGDVKKLSYTPTDARVERLEKKLEALRKEYASTKDPEQRAEIKDRADQLIEHAKADDPRMEFERPFEGDDGTEPDPFGNVHAATKGKEEAPIHTDLAGASTEKNARPNNERLKPAEIKALTEKFETLRTKAPSAAAKTVAQRGLELLANEGVLNKSAHRTLFAMLSKGTKVSDVSSQVNALYEKYSKQFAKAAPEAKQAPAQAKKAEAFRVHDPIDTQFVKGDYPELKDKAAVDDYLLRAYKRWGELDKEYKRVVFDDDHPTGEMPQAQMKAYSALSELFADDSHADLGSFDEDFHPSTSRDEEIRAMLKKAAPEVAAQAPKASLQSTGASRVTPQQLKDAGDYVSKVLGPQVKTVLDNIPHAGEYAPDVVRISVHALNPMSVAYHESLHGFFDKLMQQGNSRVADVLERAAISPAVQNQLRRLLAGERAALSQLSHPEEAAAYMYQFWAAGKLTVGDQAKGVFTRIKEAIAKAMGIWTNDQRAEAIMEYFHSGEFAKAGLGQPNAVARALLESGRNQFVERAKTLTKPLADAADALTVAGGQRLRDTGVPALRELADLMKATGREAREDHGFIPAARAERTRVLNEFMQGLAKAADLKEAHYADALQALQTGGTATSTEGRIVQRAVQQLLADQLSYMRRAGVDVAKVQPRQDYFPRLYDAHYISRHQDAFVQVLERHGITTAEARRITSNLMATDGAEFTVETDRPGMQNLKRRELAMIPDAELAPFMRKNLFEILGSYVTQSTRRAEWARRFGDDGLGITRLLERAKVQGAEAKQVEAARKYVRAIDGTLGDGISPAARRLMGNVIVYQNLRLLPLAVFSSVVDPLGVVVRGGTVSDAWRTFKRGVAEIPANFKKDFKADADTELAATLGVIDDAMLAHTTSQLYTQGMVGDGVKKINDAFFRFNLMEGFNRSMRVGATQAAIRFLARHADGTASPHSTRWLAELGLKPGEFDPTLKDVKTRAAINQWVDGAVLRPDAADKPVWMSDPHWMLVSHLKQFVFSFQETILKRVAHEAREGNYAPAMALSAYVPVMIASDLIKGLIQGGGSLPDWKQDWGPEDYIGSGIERAGLLGKLQFPIDGIGMMAGPTAQQAMQLAETIDGKGGAGRATLKALPASTLYAGWIDGGAGSRIENSMSTD